MSGPAVQVLSDVSKIAVCANPEQQGAVRFGLAPMANTVPFGRSTPGPISNEWELSALSANETGTFGSRLHKPLIGSNHSEACDPAGHTSAVRTRPLGSSVQLSSSL